MAASSERKKKRNPIKALGQLYLGKTRYGNTSFLFFLLVIILVAVGFVMMSSASYALAFEQSGSGTKYSQAQLENIALGFVAMFFLMGFDYHNFKWKIRIPFTEKHINLATLLYFFGLILLLLVFVIGVDEGGSMGAKRWLVIGPINFQPSEVAKFTLIIFFAYKMEQKHKQMNNILTGIFVYLLFFAIYAVPLWKQPHKSGTILLTVIALVMIFCGECNWKQYALLAVAVLIIVIFLFALELQDPDSYVSVRFRSLTDPFADVLGDTWQTSNSLIAIGSGGLFGLGFGNSRQKYLYLPEAQSDFVFSIVCEELGFVGATIIILLFLFLIIEGYAIAARCQDKFGCLIAVGITTQIAAQTIFNLAVVSNIAPNTGISLPFFSYGGTAILMQLAEMGIMLNISRKRYYPEESEKEDKKSTVEEKNDKTKSSDKKSKSDAKAKKTSSKKGASKKSAKKNQQNSEDDVVVRKTMYEDD